MATDHKPSAQVENKPEWIWYCESTSGVPVVTFGPKHPQQSRYKLAEIQPTEHDHLPAHGLERDPKALRSYCQQLLDIISNYEIASELADEDRDLVDHISSQVDPAHSELSASATYSE